MNELPIGTLIKCPRCYENVAVTQTKLKAGLPIADSDLRGLQGRMIIARAPPTCASCDELWLIRNRVYTSNGWWPR